MFFEGLLRDCLHWISNILDKIPVFWHLLGLSGWWVSDNGSVLFGSCLLEKNHWLMLSPLSRHQTASSINPCCGGCWWWGVLFRADHRSALLSQFFWPSSDSFWVSKTLVFTLKCFWILFEKSFFQAVSSWTTSYYWIFRTSIWDSGFSSLPCITQALVAVMVTEAPTWASSRTSSLDDSAKSHFVSNYILALAKQIRGIETYRFILYM